MLEADKEKARTQAGPKLSRSGRSGSARRAGSGHLAADGLQRKFSSSSGQRASLACEVG
jgi:hypothetical protein